MKRNADGKYDLAYEMGDAINDEFFNTVFKTAEVLWSAIDDFTEKWAEENKEALEEVDADVDSFKDHLEGLSDMEITNVEWIDGEEALDPPVEFPLEGFEERAQEHWGHVDVGEEIGDEVSVGSSQVVMTSAGFIEGDCEYGISGKVIEGGKVRIDKLWYRSMPQQSGFDDYVMDSAYNILDDLKGE